MKTRKNLLALLLAALILACAVPAGAAADTADSYLHRSNIVFVTDESGSMKYTDPDNDRYEAIRLFLAEMANTGNYVGSVSFGEDIVDASPVRHMDGQAAKDDLLAGISDQEYSNYTNIGMGLLRAVELLDSGRDPKLDSAIILLTDGNTDMPDKNTLQESVEMKAEAIEQARQKGYKIYSISLNVNGAADSSELYQIAEATGGEFAEIDDSGGLNDVETMFNKLIFHSFEDEGFSGLEFAIGSDGTVEAEFTIPNIGVEEINVLFEGKLSDCALTDPQGRTFDRESEGAVIIDGNDFILAKVQQPVGGKWTATAYGDPESAVSLRILYNSDFYVTAELDCPEPLHVGDTVEVSARLGETRGVVTDISRYTDVDCSVHITCGGKESTVPMQLGEDGFSYRFQVEEGTYYISVSASRESMESTADEVFEISVNNETPVASDEELSAHANIWPFIGGSASVDLTAAAQDPDGQELVYTVVSSAFNEDDYTLDGSRLTVKNFSIPKGSFEIMASDPYGAYCTVDVRFTSTNIGLIMAILTLVGMLVGVIAVILGIRAAMGKSLAGELSVAVYNGNRTQAPYKIGHGRGRIPLSRFSVEPSILPDGCKFQCDGRNHQVKFISKTPVYADNMIGSGKTVRVRHGFPVRISVDKDLKDGIIVNFISDDPNASLLM